MHPACARHRVHSSRARGCRRSSHGNGGSVSFRELFKRTARPRQRGVRPVTALDLSRTAPISRTWGMDRGKAIDRRYIEAFLQANRERIRGQVVEIAEAKYVRMFG